jgi:hypothetical protein
VVPTTRRVVDIDLSSAFWEETNKDIFPENTSPEKRASVHENDVDRIAKQCHLTGERPNRKTTFSTCPHCECTILVYVVDQGIDIFPYVGASKLSCFACYMFFQAYNEVYGSGGTYFTRGSRGKMYLPWVAPQFKDSETNWRVQRKMFDLLKELRRDVYAKRQRIGSDSSAGSPERVAPKQHSKPETRAMIGIWIFVCLQSSPDYV